MEKIRIIEFFFENRLHWQLPVEKNSTIGYLMLRIYLPTNKILIRNSSRVFDIGGGDLSHKKMRYNYSKKMFTGRAKPVRIIGDPDNQRPVISGVLLYCGVLTNLDADHIW
jgi:hypothetical protein